MIRQVFKRYSLGLLIAHALIVGCVSVSVDALAVVCVKAHASKLTPDEHREMQLTGESWDLSRRQRNSPFWSLNHSFFKDQPTLESLGIDAQNPEWVRLQFPGSVNPEAHAKIYVQNVTDSVREVFAPAFESGNLGLIEFERLLSQQNQMVILGENSAEPYGGFYRGENWKDSVQSDLQKARKKGQSPDEEAEIKKEIEFLQNQAGRYRRLHVDLPLQDVLPDMNSAQRLMYMNHFEGLIRIPDIPMIALPTNNFSSSRNWNHRYPDSKHMMHYISRMQKLITQIRGCESCSREQVVLLVADYYHTAVNAHLFPRVNQSMLMSQVNYILRRIGLRGLKHASLPPLSLRLDAAAIGMSREPFLQFFLRQIIEQQISSGVEI